MKKGSNVGSLLPVIGDVMTDQKHYIDNLFADTWKKPTLNKGMDNSTEFRSF